jgi:DNA-binding beta-propeller fold protein YncE
MQGEWQHTVGSEGDHPGQFNDPRGLTLTPDEAFLLVADRGNCRVAVLRATDGTWVRQLTGPPGTLRNPWGVAVVPSTGEVLVSDMFRNQVVRFRSIDDDTVVGTLGTGCGSGPTQFYMPMGLAVLDGSHRPFVCFFHFLLSYSYAKIFLPYVSARDGPLQEGPVVVVADYLNSRLSLLRLGDGTIWKHLGSKGTEPGQFICPMAVAVTGARALVVTDRHRVQMLTVDGAVLCVLDPTAVVGVGRLGFSLFRVALYPGTDEILVTDCDNHRVVALSWSPEVYFYEQFRQHPFADTSV